MYGYGRYGPPVPGRGVAVHEDGLYRDELLDHFRHPRNKGGLEGADVVRRGSNVLCGDEVEVGISASDGVLSAVRFRGRGCAVCIASASMMTEVVDGMTPVEARAVCTAMRHWFGDGEGGPLTDPPAELEALAAVREYPARRRCVLLSWEALAEALDHL